jgi:hypothetical protein
MPRSNAPKITMIFGPERGCTVMPLPIQVLSNLRNGEKGSHSSENGEIRGNGVTAPF